jgi:hypothetical protein
MNGSQFWELYQSYGDVYRQEVLSEEYEELDEVTGRGYIEPISGKHTKSSETNRTQKPGSPAMGLMGRNPYSKNRTKAQYVQSLPATQENKRRLRKLNTAERTMTDKYRTTRQAAHDAAHQERQKWQDSYEYDLYDVVLEHLLDEGFADTLEDAQVLMANMSEQWIDSIVEASEDSEVAGELARLRGQMRTAMQKGDDSAIQSISRRLAEIQPAARAKIGAEMRGLNKRKSSTVQEDASTINYYQRLLSAAQREGDKSKVVKYGRMIDKIQQSASQRG